MEMLPIQLDPQTTSVKLPTYKQDPLFLSDEKLALSADEKEAYRTLYHRLVSISTQNLKDFTDKDGNVFVIYTNNALAKDSGLKLTTLKKVKKALINKNLIKIDKIPGSRAVRIYLFFPESAHTYSFNVNRSNKSNSGTFNTDQMWQAAVNKSLGNS